MNKKGNILIFKFASVLGGGERFSFLLGKGLVERGYEIKFFSNYHSFIKKLKSAGLRTRKIYWGREVGAIRNIPEYFVLLPINILRFFFILLLNKRWKIQNIVIFQNLNEKIFATRLARLLGYKVFWVEHISVGPWLTKGIFKNGYKQKSFIADKIIAVSSSIKNDLIKELGISPEKIDVVYNGVELNKFFVLDYKTVENEKKKYGFFKDSKIIGYTGRLHSEKGLDVLLRSFSELLRRFDHIYLLLVGEGPERKKLESLVSDLGLEKRVLFLGYKENIALFLNMIDVFVLPSKVRESFGISLIEAMAVGKAVVASNIGGIPEIIDDGVNGLLFSPGSERELTDKLSKLFSDEKLRERMGQEALKKVKNSFSLDIMLSKFEKIFLEYDNRN